MVAQHKVLIRPPEIGDHISMYSTNFSQTIKSVGEQVLIDGPGRLFLTARLSSEVKQLDSSDEVSIIVSLKPVRSERTVRFEIQMNATQPKGKEEMRWVFG